MVVGRWVAVLTALVVLAGCSSSSPASSPAATIGSTVTPTAMATELPAPTVTLAPSIAPTPTPGPTALPLSAILGPAPKKISTTDVWTAIKAAWNGDPNVQAAKPLSWFQDHWSGCQTGVNADRDVICRGMMYLLWTVYRSDANPLVYHAVDSIWRSAATSLPSETVQDMKNFFAQFGW
jgi:hypothetical protein